MKSVQSIVAALVILACAITSLTACSGGSDSGGGAGGVAGVYTSVDHAELTIEFTSGGAVKMAGGSDATSNGTYVVDGEKIIVSIAGQKHTFTRDGDCIEEGRNIFGKLCKGGKAGAAANVSTRTPPPTTGTWVATNADGEFTIAFKPDAKFTFSVTPVPGSQIGDKPEAMDGKYEIEGDTMYATLNDSKAMVLKWVNGAYESSAFGLPMKFTKK